MKNTNDLMKEVTLLQRRMMLTMLKTFWPFILGGVLFSGGIVVFLIWLIMKVTS